MCKQLKLKRRQHCTIKTKRTASENQLTRLLRHQRYLTIEYRLDPLCCWQTCALKFIKLKGLKFMWINIHSDIKGSEQIANKKVLRQFSNINYWLSDRKLIWQINRKIELLLQTSRWKVKNSINKFLVYMMPDTRFNKLTYWFTKNKNEIKRGKSMFFSITLCKSML